MSGTFRRHAAVAVVVLLGFGVACASGGDDSALYGSSGPITGHCSPACADPTPVCCNRDGDDALMCHMSEQFCRCDPWRTSGPCGGSFPSCCDTGDGRGNVCRNSMDCL
jgi:hypothetical protein